MRLATALLVTPVALAIAQVPTPSAVMTVREADLRRDLFALAGPRMRGREGGTVDELRASVWIADQLRGIGVAPLGQDGSYFQWFAIRRSRISTTSSVAVAGRSLSLWSDVFAMGGTATVSGPAVWVGASPDSTTDVRGRVVITPLRAAVGNANSRLAAVFGRDYALTTAAVATQGRAFVQRGAAAVIFVADSIAQAALPVVAALRSRGSYDVDGAPRSAQPTPPAQPASTAPVVPLLLVREGSLDPSVSGDATIRLSVEQFDFPSVNIIGVVRGTDPQLRNEYVLFSSHQDHDGVRFAQDGDSIWHGADDNGTTSVALLAAARAFVKSPGKRSALFVFHGAEEKGLLGSRYHAAHPVVPLSQIVAVLNGDMMGRNHPDSASLLGIQPPHRNSADLVAMALDANNRIGKFALDSIWDRPTHPEGWYFRSDHVPYARLRVPAVFFSTNLHPDYHTVRDTPDRINYQKLTRMARWMYLTGWIVANTPRRPRIDPGFQLER